MHVITLLRFEIANVPRGNFHAGHFAEKSDEVAAMINKQHFAALLCLLVCGFVPALTPLVAQQPRYPFNDPSLPTAKRIVNLLSLMTIDEKINCLSTNTGCRVWACRATAARKASTEWCSDAVTAGACP